MTTAMIVLGVTIMIAIVIHGVRNTRMGQKIQERFEKGPEYGFDGPEYREPSMGSFGDMDEPEETDALGLPLGRSGEQLKEAADEPNMRWAQYVLPASAAAMYVSELQAAEPVMFRVTPKRGQSWADIAVMLMDNTGRYDKEIGSYHVIDAHDGGLSVSLAPSSTGFLPAPGEEEAYKTQAPVMYLLQPARRGHPGRNRALINIMRRLEGEGAILETPEGDLVTSAYLTQELDRAA